MFLFISQDTNTGWYQVAKNNEGKITIIDYTFYTSWSECYAKAKRLAKANKIPLKEDETQESEVC